MRSRLSNSRPRSFIVPGRRFSTTTSAVSTSLRKISLPFSVLRSNAIERLLRLRRMNAEPSPSISGADWRTTSPPSGCSTLMTSAPRSASCMAQNGAAIKFPTSTTRMPASGGLLLIELRRRVGTKPLAQHLGAVLSKQRRWHPDRAGSSVDLPRRAALGDETRLRVLDLHRHVALGRERARKRLVDAEDRTRGNSKLLEALEPSRPRVLPQVTFDRARQL